MTIHTLAHALTPPAIPAVARRVGRHWQARGGVAWWKHDVLARDPFVQYMNSIIGGYLHPGNVLAFDYCLRHMPRQGAIVEIGSFLGLSTNVLSYALSLRKREPEHTAPLFSCDPWRYGPEGLDTPQFSTDSPAFDAWARELFVQNARLFSHDRLPRTVEATSERFFELWDKNTSATDVFGREVKLGGPIAFAYIDGDHSYQAARDDFARVDRHLLPGGLLLFDDSASSSAAPGVRQAVAEVQRAGRYRLLFRCPNLCFVKIA